MNFFKQGIRWSVLGHEMQHFVLRLGAIGFAAVSALSVFWFYGQEIDSLVWMWAYQVMTVCFIILGYFAMRNLSHRIKDKKRKASYVVVVVLYLYVEVVCNLDHALVHYPAIQFTGLVAQIFSYMKLSVLAVMPIFGIVLAFVDVDMLIERGLASGQGSMGGNKGWQMPKGSDPSRRLPPMTMPTQAGKQASYPPAPVPSSGNGLGNHYGGLGPVTPGTGMLPVAGGQR